MTVQVGRGAAREIKIEAVVIGPCKHCQTGAEWWETTACRDGKEHEPTFRRDLGTVARWHKSPVRRLIWRIESSLKRKG